MRSAAEPVTELNQSLPDEVLVRYCLLGNEEAWSILINKYKNLIFSIPVKYGLAADDAADIFQGVCFRLLHDLTGLRQPRALAAWLITTTARQCARRKRENQVYAGASVDNDLVVDAGPLSDAFLQDVEREQMLREAISELQDGCIRLIEILFFTNPPMPYEQAARTLGLAKGSVGAIRMRCLEKLRVALEKKGFR